MNTMLCLHNWVSLVIIRWPWRDFAGVSTSHLLLILQPTAYFLQQKNIKTPVASYIILMDGIISDNYLIKRRLFSINLISHKLIQPVIYLTQHSMSLYFSNKCSTDKIQRMTAFLIYISDLPNNINSTVWLFADDYFLYRDINKQSDPQELQEYLDELPCWEQDWQMHELVCDEKCVQEEVWKCAFLSSNNRTFFKAITSFNYINISDWLKYNVHSQSVFWLTFWWSKRKYYVWNHRANRNSWEEGSSRLDRRRCELSEFPNKILDYIVYVERPPVLFVYVIGSIWK